MSGESKDFAISRLRPQRIRSSEAQRFPVLVMVWWRQARQLKSEAHVYYCAFKHPRMPWHARMVAACTAGYLLSPVQLIPSFIPVIGFLDDLLVLFLGAKLLHKITPTGVLVECREFVKAADEQSKKETRSVPAVVSLFTISAIWLIAAITATALIAAHFHL